MQLVGCKLPLNKRRRRRTRPRRRRKERERRKKNKSSYFLISVLDFSHDGFGDGPQRPSPSASVSSLFSSKGKQGALDADLALAAVLTVAFVCFATLASTFGSCLILLQHNLFNGELIYVRAI